MTATQTPAGRYARDTATGRLVFVYGEDRGLGVEVRRMDGKAAWAAPESLAPVTDDENLAAGLEWSVITGRVTEITDPGQLDLLAAAR